MESVMTGEYKVPLLHRLPLTRIKLRAARIMYRALKLVLREDHRLIRRGGINYEIDLAEGIDLSPDAKQIWVSHRGDGALSIIDTSTDTVTQTVTTGTKMANRVKFTLDGKRVLVSDPPSNAVLVLDAASHQVVKKIDTEAGPSGILIAPDGKRAFIACSNAGKVQVLDLGSLTITGSVATGNQPDGMAWVK